MAKSKLPNKPSALIRVAIEDFRKVLRSKKYKVNMGVWHQPNGKCSVCLAGSVMAMSLGTDPTKDVLPMELGESRKLEALNNFRMGWLSDAVFGMGIETAKNRDMVRELDHRLGTEIRVAMKAAGKGKITWQPFIRLMLKAADELEAIKL